MISKALTLRVLTPERTAFEGKVEAVFLPGSAGAFEVLPDHAPIITTLVEGNVVWREGGKESSLAVKSGALILKDNVLTVCVQEG